MKKKIAAMGVSPNPSPNTSANASAISFLLGCFCPGTAPAVLFGILVTVWMLIEGEYIGGSVGDGKKDDVALRMYYK
jgi:hypothetical protein